jgi:maleylacetoacetate isomerase
MKLFTYWRSQAAFRVRVALRLKGLAMEKVTLDLLAGDQFAQSYQALNPEGVVPTLIDGAGEPLVQSLAILEYLDEKYPDPPLLPKDLRARAHARAIAQLVAMDAHPFIVPRVRKYLEEELHVDEAARVLRSGSPSSRWSTSSAGRAASSGSRSAPTCWCPPS